MTGLIMIIITVFLWSGFCAISFMESWVKISCSGAYNASRVEGIGKIIFNVLNKVEWAFAIVIVTSILFNRSMQNLFG